MEKGKNWGSSLAFLFESIWILHLKVGILWLVLMFAHFSCSPSTNHCSIACWGSGTTAKIKCLCILLLHKCSYAHIWACLENQMHYLQCARKNRCLASFSVLYFIPGAGMLKTLESHNLHSTQESWMTEQPSHTTGYPAIEFCCHRWPAVQLQRASCQGGRVGPQEEMFLSSSNLFTTIKEGPGSLLPWMCLRSIFQPEQNLS